MNNGHTLRVYRVLLGWAMCVRVGECVWCVAYVCRQTKPLHLRHPLGYSLAIMDRTERAQRITYGTYLGYRMRTLASVIYGYYHHGQFNDIYIIWEWERCFKAI